MRYSTGLCATLAATATQAFLLPPMMEDGQVMPNLLGLAPLEHVVPVPCFDCMVLKPGETEPVQTTGIESDLIFNVTTSENRREILLNGFPVYPQVLPDGVTGAVFLPQVPKPDRLSIMPQIMPESFHEFYQVGMAIETDNVHIEPSAIEIPGWNVQRLSIQLTRPLPSQVYNVPEFTISFGEAVDAEGVEAGQIMILDASEATFDFRAQPEPAAPAPAKEHCNTLCQWQHAVSSKLAELKSGIKSHMRPHGCGGRKKGHQDGGMAEGDMPAHEMRPHRRPPGFTAPEFKNRHGPPPPHRDEGHEGRPHHGSHHGHHGHRGHRGHHGHKWRGPLHRARRVAMAILVPVIIGFAVGLATYMLGYMMGAVVAFFMSQMGYSQRGYEIVDEEEEVEGSEKIDVEKSELEYRDDVDAEEEGLPVYVEVEAEIQK